MPASRPLRRALYGLAGLVVVVLLVRAVAGKRDEFLTALHSAPLWMLAIAAALQTVALVSRSEAWHVCILATGATVERRRLYRASSMAFVGNLLTTQIGTAARIGALRRSAPHDSPQVPALIGAEVPIIIVEVALAALTSFTLVGPLGLPWWVPLVSLLGTGLVALALRARARTTGQGVWSGLAVMRSVRGRLLVFGFVLVAVFCQIARNWLLLHAIGVHVSIFDAIAVLIAMVAIGQLPIGPSVGAAAAVLILGPQGVAAVAAAGVLLTATGTAGGLAFAGWAVADRLWAGRRPRRRPLPALVPQPPPAPPPVPAG